MWMDLETAILSKVRLTYWVSQKEKKNRIYVNLDKRFIWTYLQGKNRDADVGNRLVGTGQEEEGGTDWESSTDIYTLFV